MEIDRQLPFVPDHPSDAVQDGGVAGRVVGHSLDLKPAVTPTTHATHDQQSLAADLVFTTSMGCMQHTSTKPARRGQTLG